MLRGATFAVALLACACDSPTESPPNPIAEIASNNPGLIGTPATSAPPVETDAARKPVARRPANAGELLLTAERRAAIEAAHPEAKGFLDLDTLENELYAMELSRGKIEPAVRAFDAKARGKWVLFTAQVVDPGPNGFELPVRYTPRDARDRLGLTSTWFPVRFSEIEGFDASQYRAGELMAVLAKYEGKQRAKGGYDLLLQARWFVEKP